MIKNHIQKDKVAGEDMKLTGDQALLGIVIMTLLASAAGVAMVGRRRFFNR